MPSPSRRDSATTEQLRRDIDRGLTGDKIPVEDPAAAPLGTDDEAAGTPPTRDEVRDARRREGVGRPPDTSLERGPQTPDPKAPRSLSVVWTVTIAFVLLLVILTIIGLWRMT
jgi:hypothetical protein